MRAHPTSASSGLVDCFVTVNQDLSNPDSETLCFNAPIWYSQFGKKNEVHWSNHLREVIAHQRNARSNCHVANLSGVLKKI